MIGPKINGNEEVLLKFQNWSLTIKCSLVLYPRHPLFGVLPLCKV